MKKLEELTEVKDELKWDIKRIIIGLVILIALLGTGILMLLPKKSGQENFQTKTLGVSTNEKVPPLPNREDVEKIIKQAENTLSQITSENLTSSRSAIQKIINDLQSLQEKKEPINIVCDLFCKK